MAKELLQILEDWNGFQSIKEAQKPENYDLRLKETIDLLTNANGLAPHRREFLIREALTTSDFPLLFGDVLDRSMLASYKAAPSEWRQIAKKKNNKDFRAADMFSVTGGDEYLSTVAEKEEYPGSGRDESKYSLTVAKYGRRFNISWETIINDDLNALGDTPQRFSRAATRTEARTVVGLYAGDVGTHAGGNLYESGTNMSASPLDIDALEVGLAYMAALQDDGGEPILNRAKYLVVPPALELTARAILTSSLKMWLEQADATGGAVRPFPTANVVSQVGLQLIVEPYLPILDTTNPNTGWYLFADPNEIAALGYGYLSGHETPELCMKASDKIAIGGAPMSALTGDFMSDNVQYRVRLCFGATKLDWKATYMGGKVS